MFACFCSKNKKLANTILKTEIIIQKKLWLLLIYQRISKINKNTSDFLEYILIYNCNIFTENNYAKSIEAWLNRTSKIEDNINTLFGNSNSQKLTQINNIFRKKYDKIEVLSFIFRIWNWCKCLYCIWKIYR